MSSEVVIKDQLSQQQLYQICESINQLIKHGNKYFDAEAPWKLVNNNDNGKTEQENMERLYTVLLVITEFIRRLNILISPLVPESSKKIVQLYNFDGISSMSEINNNICSIMGLEINEAIAIFPRIDRKLLVNTTGTGTGTGKVVKNKNKKSKQKEKVK